MIATINFINRLKTEKLLCFGVGIPQYFYDKLTYSDKKIGIDQYDTSEYPRLWSGATKREDIKKSVSKGKYDTIVINDSKHIVNLEVYFKKACKLLSEGGKIVLTHSLPNRQNLITKDYKPHQIWCGDVWEFILSIKSKGGYKIESFEIDYGVTVVTIDDKVKPQDIEVGAFEDWYFERKKLMNIK